jgi:ATP-dependent DNA helicase RecG
VTPDKIVVKSPGGPVEPITLEQLQALNAPMLSRNPVLHFVYNRLGLAEERGLGLHTMRVTAVRAGLPLPIFTWEDPYLVLTLFRTLEAAGRGLTAASGHTLNQEEQAGLAFLASRSSTTRREFAEAMGLETRQAQRQLKRLVDMGLVRSEGQGPATRYVIRPVDRVI